jgi:iron complex outermembrane receptor protein
VIDGFINGVNAGFAGPTLIADNHFRRRDYTQELRVQSDFSDIPVDFLVGAFYQDGRVANRVYVGGNLAYGFPQTLVAGGNDVKIKTYSAFGQLRWHPVEQLEIAGGVRYTDEKRHDDGFALTDIDSPRIPVTPANPTLRSKNWSPELTITYTPTDDLTIFGALKQGYKSGSFIMTAPAFEGQVNDFDDERVRGGEVGVKARLFDRALSVNTAFYYYKYDDLQVGSNEIPDNGIPLVRTINAGKSKVYGVDFDLTYRPPSVDGLTARLGINWNHGRFVKFENAPCWGGQTIADGCNMVVDPNTGNFVAQDLSGSRLPKAADWQIIGGIDYDLPIGGDKILGLGLNGQYSSKYLTNLGRRPDFFQPSYFKLNGRIALKTDDDAWELAVIGNNLTNKFVAGNCTNFSAETGQIFGSPLTGAATRNIIGVDELACIPDPGRQIFLRLTIRPTVM